MYFSVTNGKKIKKKEKHQKKHKITQKTCIKRGSTSVLVLLINAQINGSFPILFLSFFTFVMEKYKKTCLSKKQLISASEWRAEHPFAGQNTQQLTQESSKKGQFEIYYMNVLLFCQLLLLKQLAVTVAHWYVIWLRSWRSKSNPAPQYTMYVTSFSSIVFSEYFTGFFNISY